MKIGSMFGRKKAANGMYSKDEAVELMSAINGTSDSLPYHKKLAFPPAAAMSGLSISRPNQHDISDESRVLRGGRHAKGLARFGLPKGSFKVYLDDLYHTLLNMPRYRFLASFFTVYLVLYLVFSLLYINFKADCVGGEEDMNFYRAFWFSAWTASTIGYSGDLGPNPNCHWLNAFVTFQLMVAALIDTMLMSLVFSRFAAPMPRASTIRFSTHAVLARHPGSTFWAISFRLANIRKHSLLEPEIQLLMAVPEGKASGGVAFKFQRLELDDELTQITSLKLGLPATVTHVITSDSPLFSLSLAQMEEKGIELLCFMSGIDPMTSNMLQAQHAWRPAEIRMNERFVGIQLATNRRGRLGLDLSVFDSTAAAEGMGIRDDSQALLYPVPTAEGQSKENVLQHMQDLRQCTLKSISGRYHHDRNSSFASSSEMAGGETEIPSLPVSQTPGKAAALPPLRQDTTRNQQPVAAQQWDVSVRSLCEAILADSNASGNVRQQAAAVHAAMLATPSLSEISGGEHKQNLSLLPPLPTPSNLSRSTNANMYNSQSDAARIDILA